MDKRLLEELNRYKSINKYAEILMEQAAPPAAPEDEDPNALPPTGTEKSLGATPPAGAEGEVPPTGTDTAGSMPSGGGGGGGGAMPSPPASPAGGGGESLPTDELGGGMPPESDDTTEELDITDLVNMTKSIKQGLENKTEDNSGVIQKMEDVFTKLSDLGNKLGEMDKIIQKIDQLGAQVQQMKPPTPVEKLEMRSLDSYPFNEKPSEFFANKQGEMKASGKNDYVLTKDDVQNYARSEVRNSFNPQNQEYDPVKY